MKSRAISFLTITAVVAALMLAVWPQVASAQERVDEDEAFLGMGRDLPGPDEAALFELGFFTSEFENVDTETSETVVGGTVALGIRMRAPFTFLPRVDIGATTGDAEATLLSIRPINFLIEFITILTDDEAIGFSLGLEVGAGLQFLFSSDSVLTGDDVIFYYLPIEGALAARMYFDMFYAFAAFQGGYDVGLDSDTDFVEPEDQWRIGFNVGIGILF